MYIEAVCNEILWIINEENKDLKLYESNVNVSIQDDEQK
jgi:hypothetical protein